MILSPHVAYLARFVLDKISMVRARKEETILFLVPFGGGYKDAESVLREIVIAQHAAEILALEEPWRRHKEKGYSIEQPSPGVSGEKGE